MRPHSLRWTYRSHNSGQTATGLDVVMGAGVYLAYGIKRNGKGLHFFDCGLSAIYWIRVACGFLLFSPISAAACCLPAGWCTVNASCRSATLEGTVAAETPETEVDWWSLFPLSLFLLPIYTAFSLPFVRWASHPHLSHSLPLPFFTSFQLFHPNLSLSSTHCSLFQCASLSVPLSVERRYSTIHPVLWGFPVWPG